MARHASPLQSLLVDDRFDGDVYPNEPMSRHTTYRIGGPARFFVRANSIGALTGLIDVCAAEGVPWVMVGRGSNVLVADEGFAGVVVALGRDFRSSRFENGRFMVGAGATLSSVVQDAFRRNLGGFEFAVGTPGTVGGALRMNAGSRDEWIGERVASVTTYRPGCGLVRRRASELSWGYRVSSFAPDEAILECELLAEAADPFKVRDKMEENLARRQQTQPLSLPTCGSVFKNPEGASVGRLVEELGLKGTQIGGARVSDVHGNFIVNAGQATAADVRALMDHVRRCVAATFGINLVPEVRLVGFREDVPREPAHAAPGAAVVPVAAAVPTAGMTAAPAATGARGVSAAVAAPAAAPTAPVSRERHG